MIKALLFLAVCVTGRGGVDTIVLPQVLSPKAYSKGLSAASSSPGASIRILQVTDLHIMEIEKAFAEQPKVAPLWASHVNGCSHSDGCLRKTTELIKTLASHAQVRLFLASSLSSFCLTF